MYYDDHDTEGIIYVKSPSNRFTSKYVLYATDTSNIDSELTVASREYSILDSSISIRSTKQKDISSTLSVMYRGNSDLESSIEAVAFTEMPSIINIRPHNRVQGRFELIEAPRTNLDLKPIGDATTRSRIDLQTINYGDTQRMMIGHDNVEEFESFVNFGDLRVAIPDLLYLEDAKLRLYYTGTIKSGANIEVYQPSTIWREYGITYANKPSSTQLLANEYTINTAEKYVEINVLSILQQWQNGTLNNYGLNIRSSDDSPIYFNTRESTKPPILQVRYITSAVQSYGRSEIESELFIFRKGHKDLNSTLSIKSDRGWNYLDSSLYVHRYEDPLFKEMNSVLSVNRPDTNSILTVAIRTVDEMDSFVTIIEDGITEVNAALATSNPDLVSMITIDPKISLSSEISIANRANNDLDGNIIVSVPELSGFIAVSDYTRIRHDLNSEVSIRNEVYEDLDSILAISSPDLTGTFIVREQGKFDIDAVIDVPYIYNQDSLVNVSRPDIIGEMYIRGIYYNDLESHINITAYEDTESYIGISRPDQNGQLTIRALGYSELDSIIDIPAINDFDSSIFISNPDLCSLLEVRYITEQDGFIYIKDREYLDGIIDVRQFNDLESTIMVKQIHDIETELIISKPDLGGYLYPRVSGLIDIDGVVDIRRRDVADMNSVILIRGVSSGAYYYIL
ncbi:DNRLRE domain-containing protein [Paenibacillus xylanexedens]|uniref:DNRLRE domain-containing protein n=1 Tax=Paenibacillus xylanexedens TaxID=528191 RepID=UPI000F527E1F|nr:DNRLRE domain-containing protein [Paenibacillus xylanexedens]